MKLFCNGEDMKNMSKLNWLFLGLKLVLFITIYSSCSGSEIEKVLKDEKAAEEEEELVRPESKVWEADVLERHLKEVSKNELSFVNLPDEECPIEGEIVCGASVDKAPYGFMGKVKEIISEGDETHILLEDVPLVELIGTGSDAYDVDLKESFLGVYNDEASFLSDPVQNRSLQIPEIYLKKEWKSNDGKLVLTADVHLETVRFEGALDFNYPYLEKCSSKIRLKGRALLQIKAGKGLGNQKIKIDLGVLKFRPIQRWIKSKPVSFVPEIPLSLELTMRINSIEGDLFEIDIDQVFGFDYNRAGKLVFIDEGNTGFSKTLDIFRIDAGQDFAEISAGLKAGLAVSLFNKEDCYVSLLLGYKSLFALTLKNDQQGNKSTLQCNHLLSGQIICLLRALGCQISDINQEIVLKRLPELSWKLYPDFFDITAESTSPSDIRMRSQLKLNSLPYLWDGILDWGFVVSGKSYSFGKPDMDMLEKQLVCELTEEVMSAFVDGQVYELAPYVTTILGTTYGETISFKHDVGFIPPGHGGGDAVH